MKTMIRRDAAITALCLWEAICDQRITCYAGAGGGRDLTVTAGGYLESAYDRLSGVQREALHDAGCWDWDIVPRIVRELDSGIFCATQADFSRILKAIITEQKQCET